MLYGEKPQSTIYVRCSREEVKGIQTAAAMEGRSVSDYVRRMCQQTLRAISESQDFIKTTRLTKAIIADAKKTKKARDRKMGTKKTRKRAKRAKVKRGSAVARRGKRGGKKRGSERQKRSKR